MERKSLREALVVGINSYPFLKKKKLGDLNLKAAIKDAEAIANMLEKYGKFRVQRLPKGYDEEGKERFEPRGNFLIVFWLFWKGEVRSFVWCWEYGRIFWAAVLNMEGWLIKFRDINY